MQRHVVCAQGVAFRWPGHDGFGLSLEHLELPARSRVLLLGPSGSGKSTLLALLTGIVTPQAGAVHINGVDLGRLTRAARDRFRAENMGIIFQMFNLLPYGSALDNVLLPLHFAPGRRARTLAMGPLADQARALLQELGLDAARLADQPAATLSVGQQQRVAAARALIGSPGIVIADEPTSALDRDRQTAFLDVLSRALERRGGALLMVSHDEMLAPHFDRVLQLEQIIARLPPLTALDRRR